MILALLRLAGPAYGVTVRREIEAWTGREVSIGAIYATLDRLEMKGYVKSQYGEPTPERGGRIETLFACHRQGSVSSESDASRSLENDPRP